MSGGSLSDNLRFLKALIARPKHIGAIVPSGPALDFDRPHGREWLKKAA